MFRQWVLAVTDNKDTEPDSQQMEKLIKEAWDKPAKIETFYACLKERDIMHNTILALKALAVIQQYIYKGPIAVVKVSSKATAPYTMLTDLHSNWKKIHDQRLKHESVKFVI